MQTVKLSISCTKRLRCSERDSRSEDVLRTCSITNGLVMSPFHSSTNKAGLWKLDPEAIGTSGRCATHNIHIIFSFCQAIKAVSIFFHTENICFL